MVEYLRIIKELQPKMFVWENVISVVTNKKYKATYTLFVNELQSYGYNIYELHTNAMDFGIPQHRRRVFVIGIQRVFDNGVVNFNKCGYRQITVDDIIQPICDIPNNLWLSAAGDTDAEIIETIYNPCTKKKVQGVYNKIGYIPHIFGLRNSADLKRIPCITGSTNSPSGDGAVIIKQNNRIRKISVCECFRAMGFADSEYRIIADLGISDNIQRQLAGNAIVIDVLVALFRDMYCSQPHLFNNNLKVFSLCAGIGTFECALRLFYKKYFTPSNIPATTDKYTIDNCLLQYGDLIPTKEVCKVLDIHRNTLHTLTKNGELNKIVVKNKHYIFKSSLIFYLNRSR